MRNYNNYADMITFSRASSGTALAKISYGSEMVTNGTFDDATGWTLGTGMAVASGVLNFINAAFAATSSLPIGYVANTAVKISVDVSISSGRIEIWLGGTALGSYVAISNITTSGTYEAVVNTAGTDGNIYVRSLLAGTNGNVDNLSVKPVLYDQADGTLQLFNHPANKPRVEYNAQGNRLGLLMEQARTNTIGDSNVFLSDIGTAVSSSAETSPDGTTTATQVVTSGASVHRIRRNPGVVTTTGVAYAYSVFVKSDEVSYIQLLNGGDANYFATFDLVNETVGATGSATTGTITKYPNGWYRITALYDGTGNYNTTGYIYAAASASATYGQAANTPGLTFHLFGAQNEAGSFSTSYIPTSGATATRAQDTADINTSAFGFNSKLSGTLFMEGTFIGDPYNGDFGYLATLGSGFNDTKILIRARLLDLTDNVSFVTRDAADTTNAATFSVSLGQNAKNAPHKIAGSIGGGEYLGAANGLTGSATYTGDLWTPSQIEIGRHGGAYRTTGHIKSIAYYPRRLTEAQIQKLTQVKAVPTLSLTFDGNSDSYLETSIHG